MGGFGNGRRHGASPKVAVEDCLVLSSGKLQRDKLIRERFCASGSLRWTSTVTGEEVSSVGYDVNTLDPEHPWIALRYTSTRTGEETEYPIELTATPLPWGAVRWWFRCPLLREGKPCRRQCGKLYLPPGGRYFGCRFCYDLTYESSQAAHRYDNALAALGADFGMTLEEVRRAFGR